MNEDRLIYLKNMIALRYEKLGVLKLEKNEKFEYKGDSDYLLVNLLLSELLLRKNNQSWGTYSSEYLTEWIQNSLKEVIFIDNFELLMNPAISINLFELLRELSKNKIIIIIWRYKIEEEILIYGKVGHVEYQKINFKDKLIIQ
ncbi:MAG: BREX-3 system P-loop-containing protein BrxF [Carnobacterium sp.]|nr:BREX-3 system P-loop-containing protein BrxF [Carnobacterium sp.]